MVCKIHHFEPHNIVEFYQRNDGSAVCKIRCSRCGRVFTFEMTYEEVLERLMEMQLERMVNNL